MADKPKKKRNIWTDPSPYGTYTGERGSPQKWRLIFDEVWRYANSVDTSDVQIGESPYAVLGLPNSATFNEVKTAFRKLVMQHHPDHGGDKETCRRVIAAFKQIKDETGN